MTTDPATDAAPEASAELGSHARDSPRAPRLVSRLSVRSRIVAAVSLLATLAMLVAGLVVYLLESNRVELTATESAAQEIAEFEALMKHGLDPETGEPFTNAHDLMRLYLSRNVPNTDEMLIGFKGEQPAQYLVNDRADELLAEPEFLSLVRARLKTGGDAWYDSPGLGRGYVAVQPVVDKEGESALVVVTLLLDDTRQLRETMLTYSVVASLSLLLMALVATWLAGRLLSPLRDLRATTEEISTTDLSRRVPEPSGSDDIADLTRTINGMLERLERGFAAQQRFLDDAGHELKTPLTILSGHLELLDSTRAEEVEETRLLLLDETDRMSRLVADLIVLAKARRPDFVRRRPQALTPVLTTVQALARGLSDRHQWVLGETAEVVVPIDEQRLTQALLQLCANASRYAPPGSTISLGLHLDEEWAEVSVTDRGPGVPPSERVRIFERFHRLAAAEPGDADDEGYGLGLSIVAAIAAAHGGSARVEDAQPGARFVITLPLTP